MAIPSYVRSRVNQGIKFDYWAMFEDYRHGMSVTEVAKKHGSSRPTAQWVCAVSNELFAKLEREAIRTYTPEDLIKRLQELGSHGTLSHTMEV